MSFLRHISGVGIAVAVGIATLVGLILLTSSITAASKVPAEFLPAANTVAVLHNVDATMLEKYQAWFPILANEVVSAPGTIAIVKLENGELAVLRFTKSKATAAKTEFWPYQVTSSSKQAEELLQKQLQPLLAHVGYKNFSRSKNTTDTWLFAKKSQIPKTNTSASNVLFALLLQDAEYISIQEASATTILELYKPSADFVASTQPMHIADTTLVSLQMGSLHDALTRMWWQQTANNAAVLTAILQQRIQEWFGSAVSGKYDILPLLQGTVGVRVGTTASGKLLVQSSGTPQMQVPLATVVQRLQAGRASQVPASEIVDMQLDNRFRMRSLRMNATKRTDDWQIHEQDGTWTIANTDEASVLPLDMPDIANLLASAIRSSGYMHLPTVKNLFANTFSPETAESWPPLFPKKIESVRWIWEERGELARIHLYFQ